MKERIYRNFFGLALATILVSSVIFILFSGRTIHRQKEAAMKEQADFIVSLLEQGDTSMDSFQYAAGHTGLRISLIAPDGTLVYDNRVSDLFAAENHAGRSEIQEAARKGQGSAIRVSDTFRSETFYYAVRLKDGSFLRLGSDEISIWNSFLGMLPLLLGLAAGVFLIAFLIAHRLTRQVAGTINAIDLEEPMKEMCFPELVVLQKRLDHQNRKIKAQLQELQEQEHTFTAITQNMSEGLVMLDGTQHIIYMNKSYRRMSGTAKQRQGRMHISELQEDIGLMEVVRGMQQGEMCTVTHKSGGKSFRYMGNPVMEDGRANGMIIMVLDITEQERSERMRREFSANVSHELKTPLTSISGYAELIEHGMAQPGDVPDFAAKIHREASRLLTLVNDIIKVSQLDDQDAVYVRENVDLLQLAWEIGGRLETMAEKQRVRVKIEGSHVAVFASRQMMNDLMYNLMENGIKYNKQDGELTVTVSEKGEHPCICVRDTGIGIPMKYQSRIFERFFRVDKSHSRQTGGTGLGLSIVKHVVEYYGGYIEVHSTPGEGTEIIIHL